MPGPPEAGPPAVVENVHRRLGVLAIVGLVGLVLAVILIAVSLTLPWWALFTNGAMTSWYLGTSCSGGTCTAYTSSPALQGAFGMTDGLVLVALLVTVVALAVFGASLVWPRLGVVGLALGIVGAVLTLAAPMYLYFALPGALTSSGFPAPVAAFFGSYASGGMSYAWTGAAGWFLAWLIVPIALASSLASWMSAHRHVAEDSALESLTSLAAHASESLQSWNAAEEAAQRFCPLCGARYPNTAEFCVKDSAPLKDVVP